MYTVKYRPTNLSEFIGNKLIIKNFTKWLLDWESKNKKNKCALISGLCGVGKSLFVELILKKYDYNIISLGLDEERSKEYINNHIKPLLKSKKTFNDQDNVLVISEVDCGSDYGFISCITECIKMTEIPIICICDDRYNQNIKPILNYCYDVKMSKPSYDEVYPLIYKIVTTENIKIGESGVKKLYAQSNGDIRFILNTLQMGMKKGDNTKNIQSSNIFDTTGKLFSMDLPLNEKIDIYWMSHDIHTLMIQENYINNTLNTLSSVNDKNKNNTKCLENISYSADSLSDADLLDSVFDFELSSYVAINTIKATSKCNKKSMIKFPQFLGKISTMNKNKREKIDYEKVKI